MFNKKDRKTLNDLHRNATLKMLNMDEDIMYYRNTIESQKNTIDALLELLCEKYGDQTLIVGFGKNIHPIVVHNGKRLPEDRMKSIRYTWAKDVDDSIHIEYENN